MDGGLVIGIILNKHLHRTFGMTLLPFAYFLSWWSQKGRFASFVISGCSFFWCQGRVLFFIIKKIVGSRPRLHPDLLPAGNMIKLSVRPIRIQDHIWGYAVACHGLQTHCRLCVTFGPSHQSFGFCSNDFFFWLSPVIVAGVSPQFGRWCSFS